MGPWVRDPGRFVVGGPHGDTGLTGRKIIVDTYGGWARHGGGAFSGKDPSKVDRSASYMARHVAKNVVAAGLAKRCEVQLSYAIGVAEPISILVYTDGTAVVPEERIEELIRKTWDLRPRAIIEQFVNNPYTDLGRDVIDGIKVIGYESKDVSITGEDFGRTIARLWVDIKTKLPVRVEVHAFKKDGNPARNAPKSCKISDVQLPTTYPFLAFVSKKTSR